MDPPSFRVLLVSKVRNWIMRASMEQRNVGDFHTFKLALVHGPYFRRGFICASQPQLICTFSLRLLGDILPLSKIHQTSQYFPACAARRRTVQFSCRQLLIFGDVKPFSAIPISLRSDGNITTQISKLIDSALPSNYTWKSVV